MPRAKSPSRPAAAADAAPATPAIPAQAPLSAAQKRYLRGFAHALRPVVLLGQKGLTDAVLAEVEGALAHHELVKVKLGGEDREERVAMIERVCGATGAALVQAVGKIACFYRRNPDVAAYALPAGN